MGLLLISLELRVEVVALIIGCAFFAEPIHVELADKGREVGMLKVEGQNLGREAIVIKNEEADAVLIPVEDVLIKLILDKGGNTLSMA